MDGITRYEEIEQHLLFHKALSEEIGRAHV